MPNQDVLSFLSNLPGSGARPCLFRVQMSFPTLVPNGGVGNNLMTFNAEASAVPGDDIGEIELGYMGRKLYYPGDRTFEPWTITVICDENYAIRDCFENWMSAINSHVGNIRSASAATPAGYSTNPVIQQLSKVDGPPLKTYQFQGAWPTKIGAMDVDWNTNNTVGKFDVSLRYQWWDALGQTGPTTDGGGNIPVVG